MANDIVRLPDQFVFREPRGLHKLIVEIDQLALGVGLRNDQDVISDRVFDIGDGEICAHVRLRRVLDLQPRSHPGLQTVATLDTTRCRIPDLITYEVLYPCHHGGAKEAEGGILHRQ